MASAAGAVAEGGGDGLAPAFSLKPSPFLRQDGTGKVRMCPRTGITHNVLTAQ